MPDIVATFLATDKMSATLGGIGGKLDALGDKAEMNSRRMTMMGGAMAGAGAVIAAGLGVAVASAVKFDEGLRNIQSISKQDDAAIGALGKTILDMAASGRSAGQSAQTMVAAMYDIYSSGYEGAAALDLLGASTTAAAAGLTNTEVSTRVLAATLNAYGPAAYSAKEASDILFQTVNLGVVQFEGLANVMGTIMPTASATGVSLEELGAAMSVLTRRGLDAAESATSLNQIMMTYLKPSKEAAELANKLGIEFNLQALQGKGLVASLNEIYQATAGDAEMLTVFFDNVRSARGAMSLLQDGGVMLNEMLEGMGIATEGAGAAAEALAEQQKSSAFQLSLLRSQVSALAIGLGQELLPNINKVLAAGSQGLKLFMSLPDPVKQVGAQALVAASALLIFGGGMLVLIGYIPSIISGLTALGVSAATAELAVRGLALSFGVLALAVVVGVPMILSLAETIDTSDAKARGFGETTAIAAAKLQEMAGAGVPLEQQLAYLAEGAGAASDRWGEFNDRLDAGTGRVQSAASNMANVIAGLAGMSDKVTTLGEAYDENKGRFLAWVTAMASSGATIRQVVQALRDQQIDASSAVVREGLQPLLEKYDEATAASHDWVTLLAGDLGKLPMIAADTAGKYGEALAGIKDLNDAQATEAVATFKTWTGAIQSVLPTMDEEYGKWVERVTAVAEANRNFKDNLTTIYEALTAAGVENALAIVRTIEEQGAPAAAAWTKMLAEPGLDAVGVLKDTVPPALALVNKNLTADIAGMSPEVLAATITGVAVPIKETLDGLATMVPVPVAAGQEAIASTIQDNQAAVVEKQQAVVDALVAKLESGQYRMGLQGEAFMVEVKGGIEAGGPAVITAQDVVMAQLLDTDPAWVAKMRQRGVDLMEGMRLGITSMQALLVVTGAETVGSVINAAEREAGISSPSEVMAQLGRDLIQGLINGIEDLTPLLEGTAAKAAQTVTESMYVFGTGWVETTREIAPAVAAVEAAFKSLQEALDAGAAPAVQGLIDLFVELASSAGAELTDAIGREQAAVDALSWRLEVLTQNHEAVKGSIDDVKAAIDAAQGSLDYFASAPLVGTQKFSDATFALSQHMDQLQLSINKAKIALNEQEAAVLESGKAFNEHGSASLAASQAAVALAKAIGYDLGGALHGGVLSIDKVNEILDLAAAKMSTLGLEASNVKLTENLQLGPLQRQIDQLVNSQKELTFDEIVNGIKAAQGQLTILNPILDAANKLYEQQEIDLTTLKTALADHTKLLADLQSALSTLPAGLVDVATALNEEFGRALADVFATQGKESAVAKAEELFKKLSDVLTRGGRADLIPALQTTMDSAMGVWTTGFASGGTESGTALLAGVTSGTEAGMPGAAIDIATTMRNGLAGFSAEAPIWGQAIAAYIMSGMYKGFFTDWDVWAEKIADIIFDGLQAALEAHSPSKKMIPLGKAMAAGLALGFESAASLPVPKTLLGSMYPAPLPGVVASPHLPPMYPTPPAPVPSSRTIHLHAQVGVTVNAPPGSDAQGLGEQVGAAVKKALVELVAEMESVELTMGE